jgi:hypothetical protein
MVGGIIAAFSGDGFCGDVRKNSAGAGQQVGYSQEYQQHESARNMR